MNVVSVFSLFPSKENRELFIKKLKAEILSGVYVPEDFAYMLKCAEDTLEEVRKDSEVLECIENSFDKHGLKTVEKEQYSITRIEKPKYDYSSCNDTILNDLMAEYSKLSERIKERQKMLQNIKENDIANIDTGEVINPPTKTYTKYFTFKTKK